MKTMRQIALALFFVFFSAVSPLAGTFDTDCDHDIDGVDLAGFITAGDFSDQNNLEHMASIVGSQGYQDGGCGLNIGLLVINDLPRQRLNEPVSYGVPFSALDNITSTEKLRVYPWGGTDPVDSQFNVIARYNGLPSDPTKPIRTVMCTFLTDVPANSQVRFVLKNDGVDSPSVPAIVAENSDHLLIDTGVLQARINKNQGFRGFDSVMVNGRILLDGTPDDGLFVQATDGTWYASNNQLQPDKIEVEWNGPLKAVIAVHGHFEDSDNNRFLEPGYYFGLSYVTRVTAFTGKPYVLVQTTVKNENIGGIGTLDGTPLGGRENQNLHFRQLYHKTSLNQLSGSKQIRLEQYSNDTASGSYSIMQTHAANDPHDEAANFVYEIKAGDAVQHTGDRFDDYMAFGDTDQGGLMLATRWFWENWPKGIDVDTQNNTTRLDLWPDQGEDYVFRGGSWKTHEAVYCFFDSRQALGDRDFTEALHAVKDRLILFPDNVHTADFLDYVPSKDISTEHVFQGGEILQNVIEKHNKTILAKFDHTQATHNTAIHDINYLRETRPKTWLTSTADPLLAGTPINWYGWMDFGGLVRDSAGFGSLNYEWDFLAAMQGLRFQKPTMMEESEKMTRHFGDMLIIHSPIDSGGKISLSTGGIYVENGHGGQRPEWASDDRYYNFVSSFLNNSVGQYCHSFPRGTMLQYLLTGDRYYTDVIRHIGDHLKYNYSGFAPSHADARPVGNFKNCTDGQPCWLRYETRQWVRAIAAAVDVWKATGDTDYLVIAKGIFQNALLNVERVIDDQPKGYLDNDDVVHMFYQVLSPKPVIHLYHACLIDGDQALAQEIEAWLIRHAEWMRYHVYTNWTYGPEDTPVTGGTYGTGEHAGEYFPYAVLNVGWNAAEPWTPDTYGTAFASYSSNYSDLFAFVYGATNDATWLELARTVYKDGWTYGTAAGDWVPISDTLNFKISGFTSLPGNAWLKECKFLTKSMYYLKVEESISGQD